MIQLSTAQKYKTKRNGTTDENSIKTQASILATFLRLSVPIRNVYRMHRANVVYNSMKLYSGYCTAMKIQCFDWRWINNSAHSTIQKASLTFETKEKSNLT